MNGNGKIEIVNLTPSGIVINSLKIFLRPEASIRIDAAAASDGDVVELVNLKRIKIVSPDQKAKIVPPKAKNQVKQAKKPVNKPASKEPAQKDAPADEEKNTTHGSMLPGEQMGREVTIVDQGQVRKDKMNPGKHNTIRPSHPQPVTKSQDGEPAADDGKKHSAFVDIK